MKKESSSFLCVFRINMEKRIGRTKKKMGQEKDERVLENKKERQYIEIEGKRVFLEYSKNTKSLQESIVNILNRKNDFS